jgi:hypothetical protein
MGAHFWIGRQRPPPRPDLVLAREPAADPTPALNLANIKMSHVYPHAARLCRFFKLTFSIGR